ncbi:hypothetical protein ABW21_db0208582 [Orbilia brochopaga]|nr:hypothetical protein ABW21_db0208582 [Drechslerella brochopaga]
MEDAHDADDTVVIYTYPNYPIALGTSDRRHRPLIADRSSDRAWKEYLQANIPPQINWGGLAYNFHTIGSVDVIHETWGSARSTTFRNVYLGSASRCHIIGNTTKLFGYNYVVVRLTLKKWVAACLACLAIVTPILGGILGYALAQQRRVSLMLVFLAGTVALIAFLCKPLAWLLSSTCRGC